MLSSFAPQNRLKWRTGVFRGTHAVHVLHLLFKFTFFRRDVRVCMDIEKYKVEIGAYIKRTRKSKKMSQRELITDDDGFQIVSEKTLFVFIL